MSYNLRGPGLMNKAFTLTIIIYTSKTLLTLQQNSNISLIIPIENKE
jgi:hypothetical protein